MIKRTLEQPTLIIDNFLEAPLLWRLFALRQEFKRDDIDTYAGERTNTLDNLNETLFHSLAGKLIKHVPGKHAFTQLQTSFTLTDGSYGKGWIHEDEPFYNVAGIIYLNPEPPKDSGTVFYRKTAFEALPHFNEQFFAELDADPKDRMVFEKYKDEQRKVFKRALTVENVYNRCVLFPPNTWHSVDSYFGTTKEDSRLVITIFGTAV